MKDRHRILFIASALYGGGAERVCCTLASALAENNDVVILYRNERGRAYPLDSRVRTIRMKVKDDGPGHPMQKVMRPFSRYFYCMQVKRSFKPDVSVSFLFHPNLLNILSGGQCRLVCSERNNPRKAYGGRYFLRTKWLYRIADHVVFQSEFVRNLYSDKIKEHSRVIPNPVCVGVQASEKRTHRIVNMGRLVSQKNQAMLIRSFSRFHRRYPEYTLTIYGDGPMREDLIRLAKKLNIEAYVHLPGNVEDVHHRIADAEMFVLSSDYEGMSNALLECMAMGIACISTACEGSVDVITNEKNGLLVPVGDEDAIVHAMERLAGDEELRTQLGNRAASDMKALAPEKIIKEWEKVLFADDTLDQVQY